MSNISRFFKFYWQANTKRNSNSPFITSFIEEVLEDQRTYYDFGALERLRTLLKMNARQIQVTDLGAGSKVNNSPTRSIASIAKSAVSPQWQCEFLFRLVHHLQPKNRLELGTSLGLSTLYQYLPIRKAPFYTLEGCPNIAQAAQKNFKKLNAANIQLEVGNFDVTLPIVLEKMKRLDYAYIDGNHQKEPTLNYFEQCLKYSHAQTVLVFDDIHWSTEMETAWASIQQHPKVKLSIDLFFMGLVFLDAPANTPKQISLIPRVYKPWTLI